MNQEQGVRTQRTLVAVALAFGLAGGAWAHPAKHCGPNVSRQEKVITVKPTGVSDTKNLQCAIDLAVKAGRGSVVELAGPTGRPFYTAQLVAKNFRGTIRGKGMKRTIIQNLPDLCVTPDNSLLAPPTPPPSVCPLRGQPFPAGKNPWPILLTVDGGDVVVSDLAIQIVGDAPTKPWTISAIFGPSSEPITILQAAIGATGTGPRIRLARVSLSGVLPNDPSARPNVENGVAFTGGFAQGTQLSGYCEVTESYIKTMFRASFVSWVKDATVVFDNNTFDSVGFAGVFNGLTKNTDVKFVKNKVKSIYGVSVEDFPFRPEDGEFTDGRLFIAHNTFRARSPARASRSASVPRSTARPVAWLSSTTPRALIFESPPASLSSSVGNQALSRRHSRKEHRLG